MATVRRVLQGPIDFIDTANEYGNGDSGSLGRLPNRCGTISLRSSPPAAMAVTDSVEETLGCISLPCSGWYRI